MSTFDDDDIEFDFFDEPATEEATQRRRLPRLERAQATRQGGPPRPPLRPSPGLIPLLRLVGLIAFAILIVVLLVFWAKSCQGSSKRAHYEDYMRKVTTIAQSSQETGRVLTDKLGSLGVKADTLENTLNDLAQQQEQAVTEARSISPPGPVRLEHAHLIETLELRATGLRRLADAFQQTAKLNDTTQASTLLSQQAQLLVASDVDWDFFFKDPTVEKLKQLGITGVAVPDSTLLRNPELASAQTMATVFGRIHGAPAGGATPTGKAGDSLASVVAQPQALRLDPTAANTVRASTDLSFQVTVENSGDVVNNGVPVTLTIQREPNPIVKRKLIDTIAPTEQKTVTFTDIGQPPFGSKTIVKVNVGAVPGESNTTNNSAAYEVFFSLG